MNLVLKIYGGLWFVALFFLKKNKRLTDGWSQRLGRELPEGNFDLWIQSASGGESLLTAMLLEQLAADSGDGRTLKVLVTSTTRQGVDTLQKSINLLENRDKLEIHRAFFPFDAPWIMSKVFQMIKPRLIAVMETELWPSFFVEAKRRRIPLLLINGRMSEKSFKSYKYLKSFFTHYGPDKIWAISENDQKRFARVCGENKARRMHNIKFDRMEPSRSESSSMIKSIFVEDKQIVVLGSVRKEEEQLILKTIQEVKAQKEGVQIALFPKHIERADVLLRLFEGEKVTAVKRSDVKEKTDCEVIVWDTFGELAKVYGQADTVFVGGSLVDLGGQNFLEPLAHGIRPVIGPYWSDFFWVGREIVDQQLALEVKSADELSARLLKELEVPESKDVVLKKVEEYLNSRKGGTKLVCKEIIERLEQ